ncbi:galanin receptor 2a-like [Littorina saxatilis]|uniref:G-protein coupled receptors family 1 profile domain-containing protein n=1 Tax=Littorina saxatilis TaxID=31220 RepID=A0AAN9AYR6_9CAEN
MENETTTSQLGVLTTLRADDSSLQGIMSTETRNQILSIVGVSVLPLIFICGTLGNIFTIVVLCCDGLRENVNVVLLCLSVSDLCYVICYYIPFVSEMVKYVDVVESIRVKALTGSLEVASLVFSRISAIFICFIAVQRFIFIAFPLRATTILTKFRVRLTCVLIYVAIICIFFPCFLIGDYAYVFSSAYNETIPVYVTTQFYQSNAQVLSDYIFVYLTILFRIVPVFLVLVLSVLILLLLKRSRKWSQAVSHSDDSKRMSSERKITRTLISVCMLFIVTGIPYVVFYIMLGRLPDFNTTGRYRNTVAVTYTLVSILEMMNSSANFLLYITTSTSFYKTFRRVFCSRSNRNDNERKENASGSSLATVVQ